jgi:hypothetical protein
MRRIPGGCHCGNIRYEFSWPLAGAEIPVRACSCTFCTKHRGTYTSHAEAELEVTVRDGSQLAKYRFGTETAEFFVCSRCGVVPLATSSIEGGQYAVVNVNTFEGVDSSELRSFVSNFDGETLESRLGRRKRTWTPSVSIRILHT